jgi:hypothetical protein
MNWIEKTLKLFKFTPTHPEEVADDVPRHRWVQVDRAIEAIGKEIEVHEDHNVFGHTTVRGILTRVMYESANDRTTLSVRGSNFTAEVELHGGDKFIVHL